MASDNWNVKLALERAKEQAAADEVVLVDSLGTHYSNLPEATKARKRLRLVKKLPDWRPPSRFAQEEGEAR